MKYNIDNKGSKESNIAKEEFILTTGLLGAPALHLQLNVDTTNSSFNGSASITQAINPPPSFSSVVSGDYITFLVRDTPITIFSGRGYLLNTPLYENLFFTFEAGGSNSGRFRYKTSIESEWTIIENTKVEEQK